MTIGAREPRREAGRDDHGRRPRRKGSGRMKKERTFRYEGRTYILTGETETHLLGFDPLHRNAEVRAIIKDRVEQGKQEEQKPTTRPERKWFAKVGIDGRYNLSMDEFVTHGLLTLRVSRLNKELVLVESDGYLGPYRLPPGVYSDAIPSRVFTFAWAEENWGIVIE